MCVAYAFFIITSLAPLDHAPWGWNSYDYVKGWINETKLENVVKGFQQQLHPKGFTHVNLDEGWYMTIKTFSSKFFFRIFFRKCMEKTAADLTF